jgi:hypothetical protein
MRVPVDSRIKLKIFTPIAVYTGKPMLGVVSITPSGFFIFPDKTPNDIPNEETVELFKFSFLENGSVMPKEGVILVDVPLTLFTLAFTLHTLKPPFTGKVKGSCFVSTP